MPDIVRCTACGKETYATMPKCPHCGVVDYKRPPPAATDADGLNEFVAGLERLRTELDLLVRQAATKEEKTQALAVGLLRICVTMATGSVYVKNDPFPAQIPTLSERQIAWSFGLCDAIARGLSLDDEETLAHIALYFIGVFGQDIGSTYVGVALKNQRRFQHAIQDGGNAFIQYMKDSTPPLMPHSDAISDTETPSPSEETREHKECPKCAETIKAKAVVCRFCKYNFETNKFENH